MEMQFSLKEMEILVLICKIDLQLPNYYFTLPHEH